VTTFELTTLDKKQGTWKLTLEQDSALLESSQSDPPLTISRAETPGRFDLMNLWGDQGVLIVPRQGKLKKLKFRLDAAQFEAVDQWLGPRSVGHLRQVLRKRYAFGVVFGLLLLFVSLPLPGDPAAGLEAQPGDPVTAVLGFGLLAMWLVARFWPTPRLLLFDAIWFSVLLLSIVADVVTGKASLWGLLWGVLIIQLVFSGLREYRRHRHLLGTS